MMRLNDTAKSNLSELQYILIEILKANCQVKELSTLVRVLLKVKDIYLPVCTVAHDMVRRVTARRCGRCTRSW